MVLFDEIEKAHRDVFNILLQILDDGRLTDGRGRTVDFKNTVVIMTSNLGSEVIQKYAGKTPSIMKEELMTLVRGSFRPEFLNRVDEIVIFDSLSEKEITQITNLQLKKVENQLKEKGVTLKIDDKLKAQIAKEGFDPVYGARPLKRVINDKILDELALQIVEGKIKAGQTIVASLRTDKVHFSLK